MDKIRARHQRCVQDGGHPADDDPTDKRGEHANIQPDKANAVHEVFSLGASVGLSGDMSLPAWVRAVCARRGSSQSMLMTLFFNISANRLNWFFAYSRLASWLKDEGRFN